MPYRRADHHSTAQLEPDCCPPRMPVSFLKLKHSRSRRAVKRLEKLGLAESARRQGVPRPHLSASNCIPSVAAVWPKGVRQRMCFSFASLREMSTTGQSKGFRPRQRLVRRPAWAEYPCQTHRIRRLDCCMIKALQRLMPWCTRSSAKPQRDSGCC